jgi:hypothetical protein
MVVKINEITGRRKNIKASRVKHNQRVFITASPGPNFKSPESLLMDKIIKNIKQEIKENDEMGGGIFEGEMAIQELFMEYEDKKERNKNDEKKKEDTRGIDSK